MARDRSRTPPASKASSTQWWLVSTAIGLLAFFVRLWPVLDNGGLFSMGQYDAGVYFTSAVGLLHGRLPYRDFLFLHPPGITLALLPFAALTLVIGDAHAMAVARLGWMALGAVNSLLVARILRPLGVFPAMFGALFYAVFHPAVVVEQMIRLEGLASTCLLGALALLSTTSGGKALTTRPTLLAGILVGLSASVKIWGVVPLVVIAVFLAVTAGTRRAGQFILGAAAGGTAVCLPFLLAAPGQMWRYVVTDQLGRVSFTEVPRAARITDFTGFGLVDLQIGAWAVPLLGVGIVGALLAWAVPQARLAVILLVSFILMLLVTPIWFPHYAGLVAAPGALTVGAAAASLLGFADGLAAEWHYLTAVLLSLCLLPFAIQPPRTIYDEQLPAAALRAGAAPTPGCVTVDDPATLINTNLLSRNLKRGCAISVDLDGYSHDLRPPGNWPVPGARNPLWQSHVLTYLRSGSATILTRYDIVHGLSAETSATVQRWPILARAGKYVVRQPQ